MESETEKTQIMNSSNLNNPFGYTNLPNQLQNISSPRSTHSNSINLVQSNLKKKNKRLELTEDQKLEIKEAFEILDCEKTGFITFHELKICLKAFGFDISKKDMTELRRDYDTKQIGKINFKDFSDILSQKISSRDPLEEIRKAFHLFDDDGTGTISLKNLRRVARELGENLSDDELQAMIDEFDLDNDGEINQEEFISVMTQCSLL